MKKLIIISFLLLVGSYGFSQESDSLLIFDAEWFVEDDEFIQLEYGSVENNFIGGRKGFGSILLNNLVYPEDTKKEGVGGTVYYVLEIDTNGFVSRFSLLRAVYPSIDKEVESKIYLTNQKWKPMFIENKRVKYSITESIKFGYK